MEKWPKDEKFVLINQTRRALLSIMLQIAEGSNRKTDKDKSLFFNRSHTSVDEVVACLDAALDSQYMGKDDYDYFYGKCENIAKQFRGLAKYLSK
ncbi:MAG: four helix bundle protein [bacterium]|nr:four helix bundle protein [bacterium]